MLRPPLLPTRLFPPTVLRPFLFRRPYSEYTSSTQINHRERDVLHTRCTVLKMDEESSDIRMTNEDSLSKMRLCKENGIQPRDLRVLDTDIQDQPASILARSGAMLFCLPSLRAVIKADRVLMLEPLPPKEDPPEGKRPAKVTENEKTQTSQGGDRPPPSKTVQGIAQDIRRLRVRDKAAADVSSIGIGEKDEGEEGQESLAPFEFLVLEALLSYALQSLAETSSDVTDRVNNLLRAMSRSDVISTDHLQELVEVKDAAEVFLREAKEQKIALDDILSEPADMRMMYLSDSKAGKPRELGEDDEVELLLESYVKHASSLVSTAMQNISRLQSASSHINLLLSSTRNRLLHLEIRVAITTLAFSSGGLIAGCLGMNLLNGFEEHESAFWIVCGAIGMVCLTYWRIGRRALSYARRLKTNQAGLLGGGRPRMHR